MNSFSVPDPNEQNSFSNRLSGTSAKTNAQLTAWSILIAIAQLVTIGSMWFAPLFVHWFALLPALVHGLCFLIFKPQKGLADVVTLTRCVIMAIAAFIALRGDTVTAEAWLVFLGALVMDGLDGWLARKTHTMSAEGAMFDMETDGIWVTLMTVVLVGIGIEPVWVLILALWRPVYALVSSAMPKVAETHPKGTFFGKAVFVTVGVVLLVASSPWRVLFLTKILLGLACVLLSFSFLKSIVAHLRQLRVLRHQ